jgi:hypothetical protein
MNINRQQLPGSILEISQHYGRQYKALLVCTKARQLFWDGRVVRRKDNWNNRNHLHMMLSAFREEEKISMRSKALKTRVIRYNTAHSNETV